MTLDLIATNVYNSVSAPKARGFSNIEIWYIGVQIPILIAIFEYGILLTMKRYLLKTDSNIVRSLKSTEDMNNLDINAIGKCMDKWTFTFCLFFMICFNILYWSFVYQ